MVESCHQRPRPRRRRRARGLLHGEHDRRRDGCDDREHHPDQADNQHRPERHPPPAAYERDAAHEGFARPVRVEQARRVRHPEKREHVDEEGEGREGQCGDRQRSQRGACRKEEREPEGPGHPDEQDHERHGDHRPQRRADVAPVHAAVGVALAVGAHVAEGHAVADDGKHDEREVRYEQRRAVLIEKCVRVGDERVVRCKHLGGARERLHRHEEHQRRPRDRELADGERPGVLGQKAQARADDVAERARAHEARRAAVREGVEVGHEA